MHRSILFVFILLSAAFLLSAAEPPVPASPQTLQQLSAALTTRLQTPQAAPTLTADLFTPELDTAFTTPDGNTAVLWLALRDGDGRRLASEPGLALAALAPSGWQVLLPGDPGWQEILAALPAGMLPLEQRAAPENLGLNAAPQPGALTGYYLPYAAGTSRWLEGSISHFQSIPELGYPSCPIATCQYAFDFTDSWHFPILASKSGTVYASRDSCADGSSTCTNFIVLQTSGDQTYQIYLHLANGTIPDKLTKGTNVVRGQYLGDSDDTGYSTSQHVHFMVTNNLWLGGDNYYWGNSIDIRFADVAINGGIPRTCYEVTRFEIYSGATECLGDRSDPRNPANDWFVSGNVGAYPPGGSLNQPAAGAVVASGANPLLDVTATATDDVKVTAVRLVLKLNGQWVEVGPKVTQAVQPGVYDWDVNLCELGPLNGPVEAALRVWDHEGNLSAALNPRTIQIDHACPPPTSQLLPTAAPDSTAIRLSWDAAAAGVALGGFELQWRLQPGAWNPANSYLLPPGQRGEWIVGQFGATYGFRLRALDANGQAEAWPANDAAEITVAMPAACVPDAAEPDDQAALARTLLAGQALIANLCGTGNTDWYRVDIPDTSPQILVATSQGGGAAVKMTVYATDTQTPLFTAQAGDLGQNAVLPFIPSAPGSYTIKVEALFENLAGTGAVYSLTAGPAKMIFLPSVAR